MTTTARTMTTRCGEHRTTKSAGPVPVWDVWIRLFHWSLALAVTFALVSGDTGWLFFEGHRLAGEIVLALVVFRICWSLVGSSNASLTALVVRPRRAVRHLLDLARGNTAPVRGHSASGGWAVLAMLALLGLQALSGLFIADEDEMLEGAFYGALPADVAGQLMDLHYVLADVILAIVLLHIAMVAVYAVRAGHDLVRPMITGRMPWPASTPPASYRAQGPWRGALVAALLAGGAGSLFAWW